MRFFVVGAGATIEECHRSGNRGEKQFPTINDFPSHWMKMADTRAITFGCAIYLDEHGITYNKKELELLTGKINSATSDELENGPFEVLQKISLDDPINHNIEKIYEFLWNKLHLDSPDILRGFIEHSIFVPIYLRQLENFHSSSGGRWKHLKVAEIICSKLSKEDKVINLNYDTVFEIGLKQNGFKLDYSPNPNDNGIYIYKPHGSLNLLVNKELEAFKFIEPDGLPGTVHFPEPKGGTWYPVEGIVPPRLNKSSKEHPIMREILKSVRSRLPEGIILWGVGFTNSDLDLNKIYKFANIHSKRVEIINPDDNAYYRAKAIFGDNVIHYTSLDSWANNNN